MYETYHSGWIETITGSMFSGKSEELIRRLRRGIYAKQEVIVLSQLLMIVTIKKRSSHTMVMKLKR